MSWKFLALRTVSAAKQESKIQRTQHKLFKITIWSQTEARVAHGKELVTVLLGLIRLSQYNLSYNIIHTSMQEILFIAMHNNYCAGC